MKILDFLTNAFRRLFRCSILATIALASILSFAESCSADSPTLLRWGSAPSKRGGPDLDEPLVTDRPDFTEASSTVGRAVAQLEIGYTFFSDNDGANDTEAHTYPEPLLRIGVLRDWLELRLGWTNISETVNDVRNSGSGDLYLGVKLGLTPQAGILPEMALIPQMFVPVGADAFTAGEVLGGLNWIYSWELTDCVVTAGSTQLNRAIDDVTAQAYTEWAQSWTFGFTLLDRLGAYTEWFGFFPHSAESVRNENYFNGGFTYLISDNIQWDIRAGLGLNDAADDFFAGTGLSMRFF